MSFYDLGAVTCSLGEASCLTLNDFANLLSIAFGINLALPVFRELVFSNRSSITTRAATLQSIIEGRTYSEAADRQAHLRALTACKVAMLNGDRDLAGQVNLCAAITFAFAMACLIWLVLAVYYTDCLDLVRQLLLVFVNFLPLPVSMLYLWLRSRALFTTIERDLADLQAKLM
ncbi:MAG: hypothetical protein EOP24_34360 [Hyphomicrobiales bacterium]|nr:MAG: hypothetical protein EOP24_34360 [Hyphomicrobiales bacterium]